MIEVRMGFRILVDDDEQLSNPYGFHEYVNESRQPAYSAGFHRPPNVSPIKLRINMDEEDYRHLDHAKFRAVMENVLTSQDKDFVDSFKLAWKEEEYAENQLVNPRMLSAGQITIYLRPYDKNYPRAPNLAALENLMERLVKVFKKPDQLGLSVLRPSKLILNTDLPVNAYFSVSIDQNQFGDYLKSTDDADERENLKKQLRLSCFYLRLRMPSWWKILGSGICILPIVILAANSPEQSRAGIKTLSHFFNQNYAYIPTVILGGILLLTLGYWCYQRVRNFENVPLKRRPYLQLR